MREVHQPTSGPFRPEVLFYPGAVQRRISWSTPSVKWQRCWYYETAQAAGTVEVLRDMPEDKVPEQFRAIRQELKQQPEG